MHEYAFERSSDILYVLYCIIGMFDWPIKANLLLSEKAIVCLSWYCSGGSVPITTRRGVQAIVCGYWVGSAVFQ
jgi:hypothetical protein